MLAFYNADFDHRLFGYPALVMQDNQALNAELLANEIDLSEIDFLSQSVLNKCRLKSTDWRLLAQIDCCPQAEMWWGSNGKLFFWIRQRDLQKLNFDNVMLQWQSLLAADDVRLPEEAHQLKSESRFGLDSDFETHKSVEDALWDTAIFRPYKQQFSP